MFRHSACRVLLAACGIAAMAVGVCADDSRLCTIFDKPSGAVGLDALEGALVDSIPGSLLAPECGEADQQYCLWSFGLQPPDAGLAFETLQDRVGHCFATEDITRDVDVNHPDFYGAFIRGAGQTTVSFSITDKSALGATSVTLRLLL